MTHVLSAELQPQAQPAERISTKLPETHETQACKMSYKYQSLTGDQDIRVLKLLPCGRSSQARLKIELVTTQVDTSGKSHRTGPKYEALSYAWEGQTPERLIICHDQELLVTANCEAALKQLRHHTRSRLLWIDAICINQTSDPEKSKQVQMMGNIYQQAEQVIVWLGAGSADIARVFSRLSTLYKIANIRNYSVRRRLKPVFEARVESSTEDRDFAGEAEGYNDQALDYPILREIYSRTWFSRMWTLQEVVLASKCVVQCGDASLPWGIIGSLGNYLEVPRALSEQVKLHYQLSQSLIDSRRGPDIVFKDRRIPEILGTTQTKQVTDPRDRVFALHGIFLVLGLHLPPPDYSKSVQEVFREITVAAIEEDESLAVLNYTTGVCHSEDQPSWVPNWGDSEQTWITAQRGFYCAGKFVPSEFSDCGRQLCVSGRRVDEIDICAASINVDALAAWGADGEQSLEMNLVTVSVIRRWIELAIILMRGLSWRAIYEAFLDVILWQPGILRTQSEDEYRTWLHAFTADLTTHDPSDTRLQSFHSFLEDSISHIQDLQLQSAKVNSKIHDFSDRVSSSDFERKRKVRELAIYEVIRQDKGTQDFHKAFLKFNRGRRFFFSSKRRIGTGSSGMARADEIALFSGASQPMIIRPNDNSSYRLLGPAYAHGLMDGGVWENPRLGDELNSELWDLSLTSANNLERITLT